MTIALTCTPERCSAFALDRERRSSRQAPSPPSTTCLENFSLPGLLIVTTHFDLLNSSEANIVVSFARAVVATTVAEVTKCIGCLHAGVEDQPTKSGRRPPGIGSVLSLFARFIPLLSLENSSVVSRREFARETLKIIVLFRTDPARIGRNRMNSLENSLKAGDRTIERRRRAPRGESGRCAINRGHAFLGATRVLLTWIRCPGVLRVGLDSLARPP